MKQFYILSVLTFFICINSSFAELSQEIGAKPIGGGGVFVSNAEGSLSALWNPAGLTKLDVRNLTYDFHHSGLIFGMPTKFGKFAFSLVDLDGDEKIGKDLKSNPIGKFQRKNNQLSVSFAKSIGDGVSLGGTINFSRLEKKTDDEKNSDEKIGSKTLWSYNLGLIFPVSPQLELGASVRGISNKSEESTKLDLGATWKFNRSIHWNGTLSTTSWELRTGADLKLRRFHSKLEGISLRGGIILPLGEKEKSPLWSAGFSVNRWNKELNYAYRADEHFISIAFDFPSDAQKTESAKPNGDNLPVIPDFTNSPTEKMADRYGIDVDFILAMIRTESAFNPEANSRTGAVGLSQLMPATARELGLKVPEYSDRLNPNPNPKIDERFDPRKNLEGGMKYIGKMLKRYDGNYALAVAAYNAGPGRVKDDVPRIRETERHVSRVMNYYFQYKSNANFKAKDLSKLDAMLRQ